MGRAGIEIQSFFQQIYYKEHEYILTANQWCTGPMTQMLQVSLNEQATEPNDDKSWQSEGAPPALGF